MRPSNPIYASPVKSYAQVTQNIVTHARDYHKRFYADRMHFRGPALHFHRRALAESDYGLKIEFVYAALVAWGMNALAAEMVDFKDFSESMWELKDTVIAASTARLGSLREDDFQLLKKIFLGVNVMVGPPKLVGHAKLLAHFLPKAVPPIDRRHTLRFLFGTKNVLKGLSLHGQWNLFHEIIGSFFVPLSQHPGLLKKANKWIFQQEHGAGRNFPWDTSLPKLLDNLIIGATP